MMFRARFAFLSTILAVLSTRAVTREMSARASGDHFDLIFVEFEWHVVEHSVFH